MVLVLESFFFSGEATATTLAGDLDLETTTTAVASETTTAGCSFVAEALAFGALTFGTFLATFLAIFLV
jgi:hypothetical protein